jgi:hypothetical protein
MIRAQFHSRPFICAIAAAVSLTVLHDVPASPCEADIAGNAASGPETTKQAECAGGRAKPEVWHCDDIPRRAPQTSNACRLGPA